MNPASVRIICSEEALLALTQAQSVFLSATAGLGHPSILSPSPPPPVRGRSGVTSAVLRRTRFRFFPRLLFFAERRLFFSLVRRNSRYNNGLAVLSHQVYIWCALMIPPTPLEADTIATTIVLFRVPPGAAQRDPF